jgi:hypothetical protein
MRYQLSDRSIASPGVIAWRTHQPVGFLLVSPLVLVGLTFAASQTDPNVMLDDRACISANIGSATC